MADDTPPGDSTTPSTTGPDSTAGNAVQQPATGDGDTGKGGKDAVLADLAKERRARQAIERELTQLREASKTDQDKALDAARAEARAEALKGVGGRLVDAELKVALVGRALTADALLTFDRTSFLTDDGDVDRDALTAWVTEHTTEANGAPAPALPRRPTEQLRPGQPPAQDDGPDMNAWLRARASR